jgi:hypothetical protein
MTVSQSPDSTPRLAPPMPPAWAGAIDLVCLSLVILAVIVARSGGFHLRVGGLRLALTSPSRPLLWALAIGIVRHVAAPAVPIHRHLRRRITAWTQSAGYSRFVVPDAIGVSHQATRQPGSRWIALLAVLLFTALTAVMTYPQLLHMADSVYDPGDPLLNLWALSWVAHQAPAAPAHLFDANIFFPERWTLAYSETLLAPALVAAPLLWMGVSGLLVYNIVFVSGFILSGLGMALLVRYLTRSTPAAIVSGIIYAYLPFRFDHYAQLQLQQAEWIPLALWAFHQVMDRGRLRDGLLLGACVTAQLFSCMYYGIFLAGYLLVVGGALMLSNLSVARRRLGIFAAGVALALALFAPAAGAYFGAREIVGERGTKEVIGFSATWSDYLAAPDTNRFYGWSATRYGGLERRLFPGLIAVALAVVALWPPVSRLRVVYALGLIVAVDLTLGFNGLMYRFLYEHVTPLRALRIPGLAVILVGFSLAVLAGFGLARLLARINTPGARAMLALVAGVGVLAECWSTPVQLTKIPTAAPAIYQDLLRDVGDSPAAVIVEVPVMFGGDQLYMYYATFHWQTLVNGYSGFFPASYQQLRAVMQGFPDARSLDVLRGRGARYAVIHGELLAPEEYQRVIRATDACGCGLTLVARRPWQGREISLYRIEPAGSRNGATIGP